MKKINAVVAGVILISMSMGTALALDSQDVLGKKALAGDYQAQRNLAYSYINPRNGEMQNPILGCAWYLTVLNSGSPKVNPGDAGNVEVYCKRLSPESQQAAQKQSQYLLKEIRARQ